MQWLVLKLESPLDETPAYALLDGKNASVKLIAGAWSEIKNISKGKRVILIIPAEDVFLGSVMLPASNDKVLAKAVPFALEENLADDIENMHFSYHKPDVDAPLQVAAINREKLQSWLDLLRQHEMRAHIVLPDIFMLPVEEGTAAILVQKERALYRDGKYSGFASSSDLVSALLPGQLEKTNTSKILLDSASALSDIPEGIAIDVVTELDGRCASALLDALPLNLLKQFQQKGQKGLTARLAEWRNVATLLMLTGVLWVAMAAFENFRLKQQVDKLDIAIAKVFSETFPDARVDSDYRILHAAMAERLKELGAENNQQSVSPLVPLASVAPKIVKNKTIKLSRLQYDESGLNLAVIAPSLGELEKFRANLDQKNIDAEIVSSTSSASNVEATVRIREEK